MRRANISKLSICPLRLTVTLESNLPNDNGRYKQEFIYKVPGAELPWLQPSRGEHHPTPTQKINSEGDLPEFSFAHHTREGHGTHARCARSVFLNGLWSSNSNAAVQELVSE